MPHLGLVLQRDDWQALAKRLTDAGTAFVLEPQLRFAGQPGEQWTMFFRDPSGNPIEVKGFDHALVDRAEHAHAVGALHLDADAVAVAHELGLRRAASMVSMARFSAMQL
jgi:hypothetical protein